METWKVRAAELEAALDDAIPDPVTRRIIGDAVYEFVAAAVTEALREFAEEARRIVRAAWPQP